MTRTWSVTEATQHAAFLSDAEGYDVAVLKRLPDELFESHASLSGDEWQAVIDLVAAAPALLERLTAMVSGMECECDTADPEHPLCDICWSRQVISKAEGRTE
jgi:hypothetical protein